MEFSFNIDGMEEMEKNLLALGADLGAKTLRSGLRDAGKPLEDYMKANAPTSKLPRTVKTKSGQRVTITSGFLKSRIKRKAIYNKRGEISRKFAKDQVAIVKVGVFKVPYVNYVEYGTPNNIAHAFVRGAEGEAGAAIVIFKRRVKRKTELAVKRLARKAAK